MVRQSVKTLVSNIPGALRAGYTAKAFYRQAVLDPLITRRYRSQHPADGDLARYVAALDREGFAIMDRFFDDETIERFGSERDEIVAKVAAGGVEKKDLTTAPSGSYRLKWREQYGPTVERLFFGHPFFEAVASHYLGGRVKSEYKIFQRSHPRESQKYFGANEHFHFDHERRTFKAFFYLSDVSEENGPLVYCPNTTGLTIDKLRKIGLMHVAGSNYELHCSPAEAQRLQLAGRAVPLTGKRGTLMGMSR